MPRERKKKPLRMHGGRKPPTFIANHIGGDDIEQRRILNAIEIRDHFECFDVNTLDEKSLEKRARLINSSFIHCSGNCEVLAHCLLFNLALGGDYFACNNVWPLYKGLSSNDVQGLLFGHVLHSSWPFRSMADLECAIIKNFKEKNERYYVIHTEKLSDTILPGGGHALNAMVLGDGDNLKVVYIDAWRTSRPILSRGDIERRYKNTANEINYAFSFSSFGGNQKEYIDVNNIEIKSVKKIVSEHPLERKPKLIDEVDRLFEAFGIQNQTSKEKIARILMFFHQKNSQQEVDFFSMPGMINLREIIQTIDLIESGIDLAKRQNKQIIQYMDDVRDAVIRYVSACLDRDSQNDEEMGKHVEAFVASVNIPMTAVFHFSKSMYKSADAKGKQEIDRRMTLISRVVHYLYEIFHAFFSDKQGQLPSSQASSSKTGKT